MSEAVNKKEQIGLFSLPYLRDKITSNLPAVSSLEELTPELVADSLETHLKNVMPTELAIDTSELIGDIKAIDANDSDIIDSAAKLLQRFLMQHFTLAEMERYEAEGRSDRREAELVPGFVLNEALHVTPSKEGSAVVYLHVMALASKGAEKSMSLVLEGLAILADRLDSHPSFTAVNEIKAASYLVAQNHRLFKKLGFTILPDQPWKASISREDFIEEYKK